jgi:hypothetical protein
MILIDANLLIYAVVEELPQHGAARSWLERTFDGDLEVGLPWPTLLAFHRTCTSPRIFSEPLSVERSWSYVEEWLALESVSVPLPGKGHAERLTTLILRAQARGNLAYDAHLAAIALEHGLIVASTDRDFARFEGLRWFNPLSAADEP